VWRFSRGDDDQLWNFFFVVVICVVHSFRFCSFAMRASLTFCSCHFHLTVWQCFWQVLNYTATGFYKTRAPEAMFRQLRKFWDDHQDEAVQEYPMTTPYHNNWEAPKTIVRVDNATLDGGGRALSASVAAAVRAAMEVRTEMHTTGIVA
jgi:hypothetical protein